MAQIRAAHMRVIEDALGMGGGYVLDFTNRTYAQFFDSDFGVNIYDEKYAQYGSSKANTLRAFLSLETPARVGKALRGLWEYRQTSLDLDAADAKSDEPLKGRFFEAVEAIECESQLARTDAIDAFEEDHTLEELVAAIERDIHADKPEAALDRLHTYCMKKFAHLLEQRAITFDKEDSLNSRVGKYVKDLEARGKTRPISLTIMKSSISIFERFNTIRNDHSFAHDNAIVDKGEARFIFDSITGILRFLKNLEASTFDN
jgi:hypothetical protein